MRRLSFLLPLSIAVGCFNPDDQSQDTDDATEGATTSSTSAAPTTDTPTSMGSTTDAPTSGPGEETGETGGTPCESAADCDDGLACNGPETCNDGVCAPGESPCDNPQPDACAVECEEGDTPTCTVVAQDADDDGDGTTACRTAPGTDCDDDDDRVYGGAEEVCDGVDNDCNGLADLEDGLPLHNQPTIIPQVFFADIAYAPVDQRYGIAYTGPNGDRFVAYDLAQAQVVKPTEFPDSAGSTGNRVFLEWSGETFAGIYRRDGLMRRRAITPDGFSGTASTVTNTGGTANTYGANELDGDGIAVAWDRPDNELAIRLLGPGLEPAGDLIVFTTAGAPRTPRVSPTSEGFALARNIGDVEVGILDIDLAEQSTVLVDEDPRGTIYGTFDIAPMGDGFAVAYGTGDGSNRVEYAEYGADGTLQCGPVVLSTPGQTTFQAMDSHDGTAVVYVTEDDAWTLYRVDMGCDPIGEGVVIETVPFFGEIGDVDINASGIGVVTQIYDDGGDNPRMVFRAFGPSLCGPPEAG